MAAGDAAGAVRCHQAATADVASSTQLQWFHRARAEQSAGEDEASLLSFTRAVEGRGGLPRRAPRKNAYGDEIE